MAYVGLRKPYVAKYDRATKTYSNGFKYSHAVSFNINPNYAEASLYGDDMQVEYEKAFTNAGITLGTTSTPIDAAEVMFGHTVDRSLNKVIFKATDESNYVGLGIIAPEKVDGANKFVAFIILSAKFADSAESFTTKGDQLQFNTPSIEGSAVAANDDGEWKITEVFDTEAEAEAFVKNYLNIADPVVTHTVTQNLTNVTSDFSDPTVNDGAALEITLTEDSGYTMGTVTVEMGGTDITATAYDSSTQKVTITSVTGDVVITASAS